MATDPITFFAVAGFLIGGSIVLCVIVALWEYVTTDPIEIGADDGD